MRGGGWDVMSSTCVQNGGGFPRTLGGGGYEPSHIMEARSPAPAWHHNIATAVKQEPIEHDSSAYGSASDDFHMSSPGGSDHNSRDSNPSNNLSDSIQMPHYHSTPIPNGVHVTTAMSYQQHGFNPLTPPSFEPMISPKNNNVPSQKTPHKMDSVKCDGVPMYAQVNRDPNTTLTPCTTPPTEVTPPKSPKNTADQSPDPDEPDNHYYGDKREGEDHLRRLQMAFERNGMLPASPKDSENRDSAEEDGKSDYEMDEVDEQGLRAPRVNSHGKLKMFKCKQCEFVAVTKLDFWEHSRGHIKAEKLLTCPKCPFVTEYKHHLEYHLRNHFGSKPFKCDKCSYSCVNKSMLNSHLKSHSNVYQYRCADCAYATKYCHSLKLHLRKYKHSPAMVLNPDGTPNPLPVIDVYGTRRGPKQKSHKTSESESTPPPTQTGLPQQSIFPHFMLSNSQAASLSLPFPYGPLLGAFPGALGNSLLFPQVNSEQVSPTPSIDRSSPESFKIDEDSPDSTVKYNAEEPKTSTCSKIEEDESAVLDLSKPEITLPINVPEVPAPANMNKNRRKGRAFKLERLPAATNAASEDEEPDEKKNKNMEAVQENDKGDQKVTDTNKKSDIFNCQYCDITFKNIVMYTMHMGYHGYNDPFTCNMCGQQSDDKVSFFLHIARTSHS